eukprot:1402269-Pyramimonas_sp.AAC.1
MQDLSKASNIMTSRYVHKLRVREEREGRDGARHQIAPARRSGQRLLASAAARNKQRIIVSLNVNMALLQGLTYQELAEATGEKERMVRFILTPGSATVLRSRPGFELCDESKHSLQCLKPGTCTKDATRAFSLELRKVTRDFGLRPTSYDEEYKTSSNLLTAKHLGDINMAGTEDTIDKHDKCVEDTFGKCKLSKLTYTNCVVRHTKGEDGNVTLDQDECIKQLRPIQHPELPCADAGAKASRMVADMFVSLRGALAYALITQV